MAEDRTPKKSNPFAVVKALNTMKNRQGVIGKVVSEAVGHSTADIHKGYVSKGKATGGYQARGYQAGGRNRRTAPKQTGGGFISTLRDRMANPGEKKERPDIKTMVNKVLNPGSDRGE